MVEGPITDTHIDAYNKYINHVILNTTNGLKLFFPMHDPIHGQ